MRPLLDLLAQTNKTRRILTTLTLDAQGWTAGKVHPGDLVGPQVRLYFWDLPTRWAWLCSLRVDSFQKVASDAQRAPYDWPAIRGCVAHVAAQAAEGHPPAPLAGADWEQQLGGLLAAYAGTTQTWEAAGRLAAGGHFIVLNYRPVGVADGNLRPFVLGAPPEFILPAAEFEARVREVVAIDRERHPEWFC